MVRRPRGRGSLSGGVPTMRSQSKGPAEAASISINSQPGVSLTAGGQFCWPPAGTSVTVCGHYLMAVHNAKVPTGDRRDRRHQPSLPRTHQNWLGVNRCQVHISAARPQQSKAGW
jgi:hypothetical protein